jgi:ribosomal protein S18 acetylase RimI-like enzyme
MTGDDLQVERVSADQAPLAENDELKATLGGFLAAAVPQFYRLVPIETGALNRLLGNAIGSPGSEFANAFMAGTPHAPAGIVTSLATDQLQRAQQAGTIMLMRHIEGSNIARFRSAVADYTKTVEPIEGSGQYLSRVTVAPEARGRGVGHRLVEEIVRLADGGDLWLHVAADNEGAIRLYRSLGFEFVSDEPFESRAMLRPGGRTEQ